MGVRGLSSFINNNPQWLQVHKLHDTKVVIDGSNLYHFLFFRYQLNHQFGGDFDKFAKKCKMFFDLLAKCGVEPIIVFDGGYSPDERKFPTVLERLKDKRNDAEAICTTGQGKIMPIIAIEAFRLVLVELNIPHIACDFEADDDIAILANELNCPVMSNDSDFFVYDLKAGFIPLDYMNLTLCVHNTETGKESTCKKDRELTKAEYRYLPIKFYHRDGLSGLFENKEAFVVPLFATLLGNDFLRPEKFAQFYSKLSAPKKGSSKYFSFPKTQDRFNAIRRWLNENKDLDLESCVQLVADKLGNSKQEGIEQEIHKCVQSYTTTSEYTSFNLAALLACKWRAKADTAMFKQSLSDYHGQELPDWFVERLRLGEIHPTLENAVVLHKVILPCQIEILPKPSTYQCSRPIRETTYGILFQLDKWRSDAVRPSNSVAEYDRESKNTKKILVAAVEIIDNYGSLPSLTSVPDMSAEERQLLLLCALGVPKENAMLHKDSGFHSDTVLLIGLFSYWVNHAAPKVTMAHLDSIIMSVLVLHMKELQWIKQKNLDGLEFSEPGLSSQIVQAFYESSEKQIKSLEKKIEKYFMKPKHCAQRPTDYLIVHGFSQFQTCLRDTINLNQLLLSPFTHLNPSFMLNCTLTYNLCCEIQVRPIPDMFLSAMLDHKSPFCQLFDLIKKQVLDLCNADCFTEKLLEGKKKRKSKNSSRKQTKTTLQNDCLPDEAEEAEEGSSEVVANCSVSNKFALLNLN